LQPTALFYIKKSTYGTGISKLSSNIWLKLSSSVLLKNKLF